jgi:hypothetical protein
MKMHIATCPLCSKKTLRLRSLLEAMRVLKQHLRSRYCYDALRLPRRQKPVVFK